MKTKLFLLQATGMIYVGVFDAVSDTQRFSDIWRGCLFVLVATMAGSIALKISICETT